MTKNIRGKREAEIIADDFSTFEKDEVLFSYSNCNNTSSPTSEEIICEIRKWADSIPEFLQNYQPEPPLIFDPGLDKDFDSDKISLRVMNDRFPVCVRTPSFITLGFHA